MRHPMFNVSALLLDNALKPATPLTNGAINETLRQTFDVIFTMSRPTNERQIVYE